MKRYVVGFVFTPDFKQVLFVLKNRPDWQVGKLNGIGGKLEEAETPIDAMVRECTEESNLVTAPQDWVETSVLQGPAGEVWFFGTVWPGDLANAKTMTDEQVSWYPTNPLPENVIPNLRWQIPLAANKLQAVDDVLFATVQYRQ